MDELWLPTAIMEIYNYGDCGNKGFSFDLSVTRAVLSDGIECESAYSHNAFIKKKKTRKIMVHSRLHQGRGCLLSFHYLIFSQVALCPALVLELTVKRDITYTLLD